MKKCSSCNNLIDDAAAFCDMCGAPFLPASQGSAPVVAAGACPGCGAESLPGAVFCNNCGMLLPAVTFQPPKLPVDNSYPAGASADLSQTAVSGTGGVVAAPVTGISGRFVVTSTNHAFDFPSGKPELLIGRAEPETRYFPDIDTTPAGGEQAGVSRRHARLTTAGGRVFIEDLGSTNFTFVNRQRLQLGQRVLLNPGDEVRLGRLVMLYYA